MGERSFLAILILILLYLLLLKPELGWVFARFLGGNHSRPSQEVALENAALKSELAVLREIKNQLPANPNNFILGEIYVKYPFNFRNQITINAGLKNGVKDNLPVFVFPSGATSTDWWNGGVLIGKIAQAEEESAVVQTIFDNEFQMAVRIGDRGLEALLVGGSQPKLTLIPKGEEIHLGSVVYAANVNLPYGVAIGEIREAKIASGGLLQEAFMNFPYNLKDSRVVGIPK